MRGRRIALAAAALATGVVAAAASPAAAQRPAPAAGQPAPAKPFLDVRDARRRAIVRRGDESARQPSAATRSARTRLQRAAAWLSWVGQAPALELLEQVTVAAVREHDLRLAARVRAGLGLPPGNSAIVSLDLPAEAAARLDAASVKCASRDGLTRFSFHLSTSEADVDRALDVLLG